MSKKLTDIIQKSIENHTEDYSPEAWERLKKELPVNKSLLLLKAGVFSLIFITISLTLWYFTDKDTKFVEKNNISETKSPIVEKKIKKAKPILKDIKEIPVNLNTEIAEISSPKVQDKKQDYSETKKEPITSKNNSSAKESNNTILTPEKEEVLQPKIELGKLKGCTPLNIAYRITNIPEKARIEWMFENKVLSLASTGTLKVEKAGRSKLSLRIYANGLDNFSKEYEITVWDLPTVEFEYNISEEGLLEFRNTSEYKTCQWFINDNLISENQEGNFQLQNAGEYQLKIKLKSEKACVNQKIENLKYSIQHKVFAPTAFSPNGDGYNDEFIVKYISHASFTYTFQVFSLEGQLLFETTDVDKGWGGEQDGNGQFYKNKKYLWRLIIQDASGRTETKQGYFTQL